MNSDKQKLIQFFFINLNELAQNINEDAKCSVRLMQTLFKPSLRAADKTFPIIIEI